MKNSILGQVVGKIAFLTLFFLACEAEDADVATHPLSGFDEESNQDDLPPSTDGGSLDTNVSNGNQSDDSGSGNNSGSDDSQNAGNPKPEACPTLQKQKGLWERLDSGKVAAFAVTVLESGKCSVKFDGDGALWPVILEGSGLPLSGEDTGDSTSIFLEGEVLVQEVDFQGEYAEARYKRL